MQKFETVFLTLGKLYERNRVYLQHETLYLGLFDWSVQAIWLFFFNS